jgi:hypothetical protein
MKGYAGYHTCVIYRGIDLACVPTGQLPQPMLTRLLYFTLSPGAKCKKSRLDSARGLGKRKSVSRPPLGGTRSSGPWHHVWQSIRPHRARQACPSDSPLGGTCLSGPLRFRLRSLNSGNNWRSVRIHGKLKILGELGRFACLMPIVGRANDTFLGEAEKALVHPNRGWNLERFTPQFLVFKRVRTDVRGKNYLESGRGER